MIGVVVAEIAGKAWCDSHCSEVFMPKATLMRAMWALLGIALTILGSSVTYAVATTRDIAVVRSEVSQNTKDIDALKSQYSMIGAKLDAIFAGVQENKTLLRGKQVTR